MCWLFHYYWNEYKPKSKSMARQQYQISKLCQFRKFKRKFKTRPKRDCTFERMLCFPPINIQGHFDQASICKDTQIRNRKHKENRTHVNFRSMKWGESHPPSDNYTKKRYLSSKWNCRPYWWISVIKAHLICY